MAARGRKPKNNRETPDRVTINTDLSREEVDGYWRTLNISERAWMETFTPSQRYEAVIADLLDKLGQAEELLEDE